MWRLTLITTGRPSAVVPGTSQLSYLWHDNPGPGTNPHHIFPPAVPKTETLVIFANDASSHENTVLFPGVPGVEDFVPDPGTTPSLTIESKSGTNPFGQQQIANVMAVRQPTEGWYFPEITPGLALVETPGYQFRIHLYATVGGCIKQWTVDPEMVVCDC